MSFPRMSWHIGDYHKDTGHLRAAGHGAYFLLCMHYWATGGLPNDDKQLAAIARMTDREWREHRDTIKPLFKLPGDWKHKRIEEELALAQAKYERRVAAGSKGGKAKATGKQNSSNATPDDQALGKQPITDNPKEYSEANASADHLPDPRTKLFSESLQTLARITGKTPDSCRSIVGKWLKAVDDEAIHVVAAIEDADRNRVANPTAWITRVLSPKERNNAKTARNGLGEALARLDDHIGETERGEAWSEAPPRLLPHG